MVEYLLGFVVCKHLKLILDKLRKRVYWKYISLLTESDWIIRLNKRQEPMSYRDRKYNNCLSVSSGLYPWNE